ncbi:hypothetical protein [Mangrovicoccus sp. HB161399]|uniref:hypothetical protein n=1 Tax=Mangrovicoccus sp. HB161399 TaxID=2720392 RepID=UPI0015546EDA|nr:hypothetical protein [Mangrovicoccus sp. HB161399]
MRLLAPSLLLGLSLIAACGTPQERCSSDIAREQRRVESLISETRTNLARGYTYETEYRDVNVGMTLCNRGPSVGWCVDNRTRPIRRAVAIDPESERRKLDALLKKRDQLRSASCTADGRPVSAPVR